MSASISKVAPAAGASTQARVAEIAVRARAASQRLARLSNDSRNEVLIATAKAIEAAAPEIIAANERDCRAAEPAVEQGKMSASMFARLRVNER